MQAGDKNHARSSDGPYSPMCIQDLEEEMAFAYLATQNLSCSVNFLERKLEFDSFYTIGWISGFLIFKRMSMGSYPEPQLFATILWKKKLELTSPYFMQDSTTQQLLWAQKEKIMTLYI